MYFSIPSAVSLAILAVLGSANVAVEARPAINAGHHDVLRRATSCVPTTTTKQVTATFTKTVTVSPAATTKPATSASTSQVTISPRAVATSTSAAAPAVRKAGLAYNWEFNQNWSPWTDTVGSKISWGYSWDAHPMLNFPTSKLNFVPMLHGNAADKIQWFKSQIPNFPGWKVTHLLSFNEPDMSGDVGGSNITPAQAAIDHQNVFNSTVSSKYKIGAPAVARGSKAWLQQWVAACNGKCKYDFVPIHFYGKTPQELKDYVTEMYTAFGKPLWITEFAAMDFATGYSATAADAQAFQNAVVPWLESTNMVERYSWFGLFNNWNNGNALLNSDGSVNTLGKFYMKI